MVFDSDLFYSVDHIGRRLETMERDQVAIVVSSPYSQGGK